MTADRILERVMLAFEGEGVPSWVDEAAGRGAGGRGDAVHGGQRHAAGAGARVDRGGAAGGAAATDGPLLIAADQEGGQLNALGAEATQFAGNMALGAVDDEALTEKVGACDRARGAGAGHQRRLCPGPRPGVGAGQLGDGHPLVRRRPGRGRRGTGRRWSAASSRPGWPRRSSTSRVLAPWTRTRITALGVVQGSAADLDANEFAPFRAAIAAGARLVMSAHVAVPALTGDPTLPATLSRTVMGGTLRDGLGFRGLTISDALDMHALAQGAAQAVEVIAAIRAGIDLLLSRAGPARPAPDRGDAQRGCCPRLVRTGRTGGLERAPGRPSILARGRGNAARPRCRRLRRAHGDLARARGAGADQARSRAPDGAEPRADRLRARHADPRDHARADRPDPGRYLVGSSRPVSGRALRTRFASVDDVVVPVAPGDAEIGGLRTRAESFDAVVVGTIEAHRQSRQAALVRAIAETGTPTVAVAMRTPWDARRLPGGRARDRDVFDPARFT